MNEINNNDIPKRVGARGEIRKSAAPAPEIEKNENVRDERHINLDQDPRATSGRSIITKRDCEKFIEGTNFDSVFPSESVSNDVKEFMQNPEIASFAMELCDEIIAKHPDMPLEVAIGKVITIISALREFRP